MSFSPETLLFLRRAAALEEYEPATLADAAEVLDTLSDAKLSLVCKAACGPPVCDYDPVLWEAALRYSSALRGRVSRELDNLELYLPNADANCWLRGILS